MSWTDVLRTSASGWTILVRLLVGLIVFLPEGMQKLMFPDLLGVGRFARIGVPVPGFAAPLVGVVEIVCGALIIIGLFTRLAAVPLIVIMIVASSRRSCRSSWGTMSGSSIYRMRSVGWVSGAPCMRPVPI